MKVRARTAAAWVIIASIVILLIWILILESNVSRRVKTLSTAFVIASPIPPVP